MAATKQGDKDNLEEHSRKKVAFYRTYLESYLRVLMHEEWVKNIYIYDVFCGIGVYEGDGSKGSPIAAVETVEKILSTYSKQAKPISLIINDIDKNKVNSALNYINQYCRSKKLCEISAENMPANEILEKIIQFINKSGNQSLHFLFIDPHGYKDIKRDVLLGVLEAGRSEILLFLPISQMYRFLRPSDEDRVNPSYKPLRRFMEEFALDTYYGNPLDYIESIRKAFTFDGEYYAANFILQADSNNYYALFFITRHLKGLEKAVEAKWKIDENAGTGHFKKLDLGFFQDEYELRDSIDIFSEYKQALLKFLSVDRNNREIYEFGLTKGFLPKHSGEILRKLNKQKRLQFDREVRKNAFYLNYKNYQLERYRVKIYE